MCYCVGTLAGLGLSWINKFVHVLIYRKLNCLCNEYKNVKTNRGEFG